MTTPGLLKKIQAELLTGEAILKQIEVDLDKFMCEYEKNV
jgi:hypothetical protein